MLRLRRFPIGQAIVLAAFWAFVAFILVGRAYSSSFTHDEIQFVASGQIFARDFLVPYRDYPFLHMPYMPFVNGILFLASGGTLIAARLLNEIFFLAAAALLFFLIQRSFGTRLSWEGIAAGAVAVGVMIFDPTFTDMDGKALNHALPTFLSLLAFGFYLKSRSSRHGGRWLAGSGLAVGLAAGVRLSFAVLALPLLAAAALSPAGAVLKDRLKHSLVFVSGTLGGLLPALVLFLLAPQQAYYGNLLYIRLNTIYREHLGFVTAMTIDQKLGFFISQLQTSPLGLAVYFLVLVTLGVAVWQWRRKGRSLLPAMLLAGGLAVVLLAAGFTPTPLWAQYFFAPVPFLLLALFYGLQGWRKILRLGGMAVLAGVLVFTAVPSMSQLIEALRQPQNWPASQAARQARDLRAAVPSGKILTLAPIVPLEAGLDTYPVFTVGPFSWRTAPILPPEKRSLFGVVGPQELESYLAQDPPAAVLTGSEDNYEGFNLKDNLGLEHPITEYAGSHGYSPHDFPCPLFGQCTLWLK